MLFTFIVFGQVKFRFIIRNSSIVLIEKILQIGDTLCLKGITLSVDFGEIELNGQKIKVITFKYISS